MIAVIVTLAVFALGALLAGAGRAPLPARQTLGPVAALTVALSVAAVLVGANPLPLIVAVAVGMVGGVCGHRLRFGRRGHKAAKTAVA